MSITPLPQVKSIQSHSLTLPQLRINLKQQLQREETQKEDAKEKWIETIFGNCPQASNAVNIQAGPSQGATLSEEYYNHLSSHNHN